MVVTAKQQVEWKKNSSSNNKLVSKIGVWSGSISPIYYNSWRGIELQPNGLPLSTSQSWGARILLLLPVSSTILFYSSKCSLKCSHTQRQTHACVVAHQACSIHTRMHTRTAGAQIEDFTKASQLNENGKDSQAVKQQTDRTKIKERNRDRMCVCHAGYVEEHACDGLSFSVFPQSKNKQRIV